MADDIENRILEIGARASVRFIVFLFLLLLVLIFTGTI